MCNIGLMNCLLNHTRFILVFLFISWSLNAQVALPTFHGVQKSYPSVLIIWDDSATNTHTVALKTALGNAGFNVTMSNTSETSYDGTNPALSNFNAVIHLNGTTHSAEMPNAGQTALVNFVNTQGGIYFHSEWLAYQRGQSKYSTMSELILLQRAGGGEGNLTYTEVSAQSSHRILENIPSSFSFDSGYNVGTAKSFGSNPVTVLMTHSSNDAVVIRSYGNGKIMAMNNAGNYASKTTLSNANIQQLYINAIEWAN